MKCIAYLAAFAAFGFSLAQPASAQQSQQIGSVFVIHLQNHNFTQPAGDNSSSLQPILGNPAAPYLNSLISPTSGNAGMVSYATAYHNVLATVSGSNPDIHPSEPNYIWEEAGLNYGVTNENDPYGTGGNVATIVSANGGSTPEHLTGLLQMAGISWRSYQEDTDLLTTDGSNINVETGGSLTSTVSGSGQFTVPLTSFSGTSTTYTNPYNGSHSYGFACKHDGSLFFADTNGNGVTDTTNAEIPHYAPLQQLATDLANNTVARYNVITPDIYNDMNTGLPGGFTYNGTAYANDEANIAQGDNFLSILIPQIMASQAFRNNGLIVIWSDETEGTNPDDFNHAISEIVISPLAKGSGYASALNYTHSSDLATMQRIFNVAGGSATGYLGDAANPSNANSNGTGEAQDLSDMFQPGTVFASISGIPAPSGTVTGHNLREHYPFTSNGNDALGNANLTTTGTGVTFPTTGGANGGAYLHLAGSPSNSYLAATLTNSGSNCSLLGDYSTFKPFSLSFWVRQTSSQQSANGQATSGLFGVTTNLTSGNFNTGFEFPTKENTTDLNFELRIRNGGSGTSDAGQLDTGVNISDGNWHHVALTMTGTNRYAYIDGTFRGSNNNPVPITNNPLANFTVGTFLRGGSPLDQWSGDLADLQVYDGVLSAPDVQQLFQNYGQVLSNNEIVTGTTVTSTNLPDLVDPMIGVAGGANTGENALGTCLPQSSIYPSPDTSSVGPGGYIPGSNVVGFSQLHASGAGASVSSYGNFLVSPRYGQGTTEASDSSSISNIVAHPYEFACQLTGTGGQITSCAVAPTANCALYQFTFASSTDARINLDAARKLASSTGMQSGSVTVDPVNGIISGGGTFNGNWNPASYNVYFYAMVDTTPQSGGTWLNSSASSSTFTRSSTSATPMGAWLSFNTTTNATVRLKIAVSFQSVAKAQSYLQNEMPGWDVAAVAQNARAKWSSTLSAIQIPGAAAADARLYYTALFHSFITPRNRTGDQASWPAGQPFWDDHYTNWDTWQTLFPLYNIISPATSASVVNSYAARFQQNGIAELVFTQGKDFQAGQGGDETDRIIADAWAKGIPGINWQNVWPLLQSHANRRTPDYINLGYVSSDGSRNGYDSRLSSASATIAFAHDDWCAAQIASGLGLTGTAQFLLNRSSNWKNCWDTTDTDGSGFTGFLRGRSEAGAFSTESPVGSGADFYEGSSWNYSFNIYHDPAGMVSLMGGRNRFLQRLEYGLSQSVGNTNYIDYTNEPAFPKTFLFDYANRPYLASYWTDKFRQLFTTYNYPGDDDSGAMSSFYLFTTSGFYPVCTQPYYYLFGSRLPQVQFSLGTSGTSFTVTSTNSSNQAGQDLFVQSATLNGQPLTSPVIFHSQILAGGTLNYVMGPFPTTWGCGTDLQEPVPQQLVLPADSGWTAALGSPAIAGGTTNSPVWSNAGNTAIYCNIPQVSLSQPGDSATMTATVQFNGLSATQGASSNLFAWGLFNSGSQTGVNGWTGYLAGNDTDSSGNEWLSKKVAGNSTPFFTASGTNNLESFNIATAPFASNTYYVVMTVTLTSANALDYQAALVRASDGVILSAFTGSDLSPASLSFNAVGLRLGSSAQAASINIGQCSVIATSASYSGRSLVIPNGGEFVASQGSGANVTVASGGLLASTGTSTTQDSFSSATFAGGSAMQLDLGSDGSTGQAGTAWDLIAVSGTLDFSTASDTNPVSLNLITLTGSGTPGPLGSWNPNTNHVWAGFATASGGITGFDAQKISVNTAAFQNQIAGTFSVRLGSGGNSLDLVYTASAAQVPGMPLWVVPVLMLLLIARTGRHLSRKIA